MNEDKYYLVNDNELIMCNLSLESLKEFFGDKIIIELSEEEYIKLSGFIQEKNEIDIRIEKLLSSFKERYKK